MMMMRESKTRKVNMGKENARPGHLPKRSLRSPTNWLAVLLLDILWLWSWWQSWPLCLNFHWLKQLGHLVNPTMSANRMETLSIVFILNGLNIVLMSPWKWSCWIAFQLTGYWDDLVGRSWWRDLPHHAPRLGVDVLLLLLVHHPLHQPVWHLFFEVTMWSRNNCVQLMMTRTKGCQEKSSRQ